MAFVSRERGVLLLIAFFLILNNAPYLYAFIAPRANAEFLGSFYNAIDTSVYLAAMREGARGDWLRTLPYTLEPQPSALFYPFYLFLGHVVPPTIMSFHLARVLASIVMCAGAWWFAHQILVNQREFRLAMLLALLGLGLGWPTILLGFTPLVHPGDFYIPESTLFMSAFVNPHFPLAAGLQFITLALYVRIRQGQAAPGMLLAGAITCLSMSLVQPYNLVIVIAVLITDSLVAGLRTRNRLPPDAWISAWIIAPSLPIAIYYFVWFRYAPFWSELVASWPRPIVFAPLDYFLGYAPLVVVAAGGAIWLWRKSTRMPGEQTLLAWFVANAALILSPLDFAERTTLGFSLTVAMLGAIGLWQLVSCIRTYASRIDLSGSTVERKLTALMFLLLLGPLLLQVSSAVVIAQREPDLPFYLSEDDATALRWLSARTTVSDVILASPAISNLVPRLTDAKVYSGHAFETLQYAQKNEMVRQFFSNALSEADRIHFLIGNHITYIYIRPGARDTGLFDGRNVDYLTPVFEKGTVILYHVN